MMTRHAKSACEEGERRIPRDLTRANFPFSFKRPEVEKRIRGNILPFSFISQAYQIRGLISFPALLSPRPRAKGKVLRTRMTWVCSDAMPSTIKFHCLPFPQLLLRLSQTTVSRGSTQGTLGLGLCLCKYRSIYEDRVHLQPWLKLLIRPERHPVKALVKQVNFIPIQE